MRTLEAAMPMAQIDPQILDIFDSEAMIRELAEINGVPAKVLRSPEQMEERKAGRAQEAQAQQLLQAAPVASSVIKDMVSIQSTARNSPQPLALPAA
jgi:hypothetical protein